MKKIVLLSCACLALAAIASNRNFCRVAEGAKSLTYAPDYLYPSWSTPTPADYLAQNWLYNRVTPPETREGYVARLDRYEARGEAVYAVYGYEPIPYVPRRIYKYDLSAACLEADFLDQLMAFIGQDAKIKWFWDAAEILVENDPYFIAATNAVVQSGVPEAKVKAIIERAVELGQITNANAEAK